MKKSNLRERRKELGLTLEAVAAKCGISSAAARSIEVGAFRGKLETRRKMAAALGISIRDLMTPEELRATEGPRVLRQAQFFEDADPMDKIEKFLEEKKTTPEEVLRMIRAAWDALKKQGRG